MLAHFGTWLQRKPNFLVFSTLAIAVPLALTLFWVLGGYGGASLHAFVVAVALGAGLVWGLLMWEFFRRRFPEWWGKEK